MVIKQGVVLFVTREKVEGEIFYLGKVILKKNKSQENFGENVFFTKVFSKTNKIIDHRPYFIHLIL